jgi:hypothetical protein
MLIGMILEDKVLDHIQSKANVRVGELGGAAGAPPDGKSSAPASEAGGTEGAEGASKKKAKQKENREGSETSR